MEEIRKSEEYGRKFIDVRSDLITNACEELTKVIMKETIEIAKTRGMKNTTELVLTNADITLSVLDILIDMQRHSIDAIIEVLRMWNKNQLKDGEKHG